MCAATLKLYLRQLPEPVFTFTGSEKFIEVVSMPPKGPDMCHLGALEGTHSLTPWSRCFSFWSQMARLHLANAVPTQADIDAVVAKSRSLMEELPKVSHQKLLCPRASPRREPTSSWAMVENSPRVRLKALAITLARRVSLT